MEGSTSPRSERDATRSLPQKKRGKEEISSGDKLLRTEINDQAGLTCLKIKPRRDLKAGVHYKPLLQHYFLFLAFVLLCYFKLISKSLVMLELDRCLNGSPLSMPTEGTNSTFTPALRGKKIFFEVTTVGLKQFAYLEHIADSVRDLCEAGAKVDFHVVSSNCNPHPRPNDPKCIIKGQSSDGTLEDNFSVETISHLNEKIRCRNPEGAMNWKIHLLSPDWGKQLVDHHRLLFYENIDKNFDVYIHTEDDQLIRPANVIAFMDEMEKLRRLVGNKVRAFMFA